MPSLTFHTHQLDKVLVFRFSPFKIIISLQRSLLVNEVYHVRLASIMGINYYKLQKN
jgi:hypothetical protein